MKVKTVLDRLYAARSPQHLQNDPLSFCHRYEDPADREVAAAIAASFAYGGIKVILRSLERVFAELGPSPRTYVTAMSPRRTLKAFSGFKHRFNDGRDLTALLWGLRLILEDAGSINAFFHRYDNPAERDITSALNSYTAAVRGLDYRPVFGSRTIPPGSYFPFFFPSPADGSACKRLCMFLRWVIRPDDGIDLGLWRDISPARLVIPVDTHISRICSYLGFTGRSSADWRMAQEITEALRRFDPLDPVKYDFSLAHLGISEGCSGHDHQRCLTCSIKGICRQTSRS